MFLARVDRGLPFTCGFWLLVAITFTLPQVPAAQSSHQLSSDQVGSFKEEPLSMIVAYQLAREIDPDLAISRFAVDGAEVRRDTARAEYFPQVSLFGEWSENKLRYDGGSLGSLPSLQYPGERYGLQLRSPILNMRSFREYERQSSLVEKTENELEIAETELLLDVASAYLTSLLAGETAEQLEAEFTALTRQLDEAQALYDRSLLPVTQLLETQTRTDSIWADTVDAKGKALIARERLAQLVGRSADQLSPVIDNIALMSNVRDVESAANLAIDLDPATAAARDAVSAAKKAVAREKGTWWPEVDFVYTSQYSDVGFDNLTSPPRSSESYAISVRYPIFEGGAKSARLRGAWVEVYTAQQKLEAITRIASGRAREAWVNLDTAIEREQAAKQASKTAEVNLEASRQAVRAGTARVTDVLLALAQVTRASRDLSEARYQGALAWLELQIATGRNPTTLASQLSRALHGR